MDSRNECKFNEVLPWKPSNTNLYIKDAKKIPQDCWFDWSIFDQFENGDIDPCGNKMDHYYCNAKPVPEPFRVQRGGQVNHHKRTGIGIRKVWVDSALFQSLFLRGSANGLKRVLEEGIVWTGLQGDWGCWGGFDKV